MSKDKENEAPWWTEMAEEVSGISWFPHDPPPLKRFSRQCRAKFFNESMSRAQYFDCCALAWTVEQLCDDELGSSAHKLPKAIQNAVFSLRLDNTQSGEEGTMASWLLPNIHMDGLPMPPALNGGNEDVAMTLEWTTHFWHYFFQQVDKKMNSPQSSATKRQRTAYTYFSTLNKSSWGTENEYHELLSATLCLFVSLEWCETWEDVEMQAKRVGKAWMTMAPDDLQAAVTVVGLSCLYQGRCIPGLTPSLMLEYLQRSRESTLCILKKAMRLESYYPLRAVVCEHLLEPVYSSESSLDENEIENTIKGCSSLLNREQPLQRLKSAALTSQENDTKRRHHMVDSFVPERVLVFRFPVMMHLSVWLLEGQTLRAIDLVRQLEGSTGIDGTWKDEAYLIIWDHLLRQGEIFLDGNDTGSRRYIERRELLYNGLVNGMGVYGRGSMKDFYQGLAKKIWRDTRATVEEKNYVLVACQQTLLRLYLKCFGLGDSTLVQFLAETSWPIACQEVVAAPSGQVQDWAASFLLHPNPIPCSLLSAGNLLDLSSILDSDDATALSLDTPASEPTLADASQTEDASIVVPPFARGDHPVDPPEKSSPLPTYGIDSTETTDQSKKDRADLLMPNLGIEQVEERENESNLDITDKSEASEELQQELSSESGVDNREGETSDEVIEIDDDESESAHEQFGGDDGTNSYSSDGDNNMSEENRSYPAGEADDRFDENSREDSVSVTRQYNDETSSAGDDDSSSRGRRASPLAGRIVNKEENSSHSEDADDVDDDSSHNVVESHSSFGDEGERGSTQRDEWNDDDHHANAQGMDDSQILNEKHRVTAVAPDPHPMATDDFDNDESDKEGAATPEQDYEKTVEGNVAVVDGASVDEVDDYSENDEHQDALGATPGDKSTPKHATPSDMTKADGQEQVESALPIHASDDEKTEPSVEQETKSTEGPASRKDNVDSNATDDENERAAEDEKAETEDAAMGGDFGDTTEEEHEHVTSSRANRLADADRRADVLRSRAGYASQLEDGYEPEDTHGYTEEEVSEAIHTEDEDEELRAVEESKSHFAEYPTQTINAVQHSIPHSSDDMDAADEHTEHEEDLGAESSELEENAETRQYPNSPSWELERDPTTLMEFAQSAQRLHQQSTLAPSPNLKAASGSAEDDELEPSVENDASVPNSEKAVGFVDNEFGAESDDSNQDESSDKLAETDNNFASEEDEKEAESTLATESLEMTENTGSHVASDEAEGPKSQDDIGEDSTRAHDDDTDVEDIAIPHVSDVADAAVSPKQDGSAPRNSPTEGDEPTEIEAGIGAYAKDAEVSGIYDKDTPKSSNSLPTNSILSKGDGGANEGTGASDDAYEIRQSRDTSDGDDVLTAATGLTTRITRKSEQPNAFEAEKNDGVQVPAGNSNELQQGTGSPKPSRSSPAIYKNQDTGQDSEATSTSATLRRSTRGGARKNLQTTGSQVETASDRNDSGVKIDEVSVSSVSTRRSRRLAKRQEENINASDHGLIGSVTAGKEREDKATSKDDDDDTVASTASRRSTRSTTRRKNVDSANQDEPSVVGSTDTRKSSRQRRTNDGKTESATGSIDNERKDGLISKDDDNDTVASTASRRSTRSTTRRQNVDPTDQDEASIVSSAATRKSSRQRRTNDDKTGAATGSIGNEREDGLISKDDDDDTVASTASRRSTRSTTRRQNADPTDQDEASIVSSTATRKSSRQRRTTTTTQPTRRPKRTTNSELPPKPPTRRSTRKK